MVRQSEYSLSKAEFAADSPDIGRPSGYSGLRPPQDVLRSNPTNFSARGSTRGLHSQQYRSNEKHEGLVDVGVLEPCRMSIRWSLVLAIKACLPSLFTTLRGLRRYHCVPFGSCPLNKTKLVAHDC